MRFRRNCTGLAIRTALPLRRWGSRRDPIGIEVRLRTVDRRLAERLGECHELIDIDKRYFALAAPKARCSIVVLDWQADLTHWITPHSLGDSVEKAVVATERIKSVWLAELTIMLGHQVEPAALFHKSRSKSIPADHLQRLIACHRPAQYAEARDQSVLLPRSHGNGCSVPHSFSHPPVSSSDTLFGSHLDWLLLN